MRRYSPGRLTAPADGLTTRHDQTDGSRRLTAVHDHLSLPCMNDLTQGSIARHIVTMAVPMAFGMLFQTAYLLIDL